MKGCIIEANLEEQTCGWRYCFKKGKIRKKYVTKWCKAYAKTGTWFQKSHEEFGQLQASSRKSVKSIFDGLLLCKTYIPLAKTLYTEDLCNVTLSYLCENSPNSSCHF